MADKNLWIKIHAERSDFADFVESLNPDQLDTPSLCAGWTVRDVIAHMISTGHTSQANFLPRLVASGFRFNAFAQKGVKRYRNGTPAELAAKLRETARMTKRPPGPPMTPLGEVIVHGEDVRRPLGVSYSYPADHVIPVADFYKGGNLLTGAKNRITGLKLRATDMDWSTGAGPEVAGPGAALVSAMTGRQAALADLKGDGVEVLATRF